MDLWFYGCTFEFGNAIGWHRRQQYERSGTYGWAAYFQFGRGESARCTNVGAGTLSGGCSPKLAQHSQVENDGAFTKLAAPKSRDKCCTYSMQQGATKQDR